jgi:putative phosphoribosyl transferase
MSRQFRDRLDAGQQLAARLGAYANRPDVIVLALPRGGVPVAYEVATALHAPLDVFLVRKLGVPGIPELAFGALASGGIVVTNPEVIAELNIRESEIQQVVAREQKELERRERIFRGDRPPLALRHQTVIVVDDGLATGATMRAVVHALRQQSPARVIVAVPTAPREVCAELSREVDELICLMTPQTFYAISVWYEDFGQTSDAEVRELLARAERERALH